LQAWRLLAHNHWFTLNILGFKIRLCSRCSGYVIGFISFMPITKLLRLNFETIDGVSAVTILFILVIPFIYDWVSQSWGLRESNNVLRSVTGISMGLGIGFFSKLNIGTQMKQGVFIFIALAILMIGLKNIFKTKKGISCCKLS